jgi:hypothetical protein
MDNMACQSVCVPLSQNIASQMLWPKMSTKPNRTKAEACVSQHIKLEVVHTLPSSNRRKSEASATTINLFTKNPIQHVFYSNVIWWEILVWWETLVACRIVLLVWHSLQIMPARSHCFQYGQNPIGKQEAYVPTTILFTKNPIQHVFYSHDRQWDMW